MSVEFISWALQQDLPTGPKFVLVALANRANENGECWPSQTDISKQTNMGVRTIRTHILWLLENQVIKKFTRRRPNGSFTSDSFSIQRQTQPAENFAVRQNSPLASNEDNFKVIKKQRLKTRRQIQPQAKVAGPEPSLRKKDETSLLKPPEVSDQVWVDFEKLRKSKKAPLTATAMKGIQREADKIGWSMEKVLTEMCARNWQGFNAEWINSTTKGSQNERPLHSRNGTHKPSLTDRLDAAHDAAIAAIRANSGDSETMLRPDEHFREDAGTTDELDFGFGGRLERAFN